MDEIMQPVGTIVEQFFFYDKKTATQVPDRIHQVKKEPNICGDPKGRYKAVKEQTLQGVVTDV